MEPHRGNNWQSFPLEFLEFPPLQVAATAGRQKRQQAERTLAPFQNAGRGGPHQQQRHQQRGHPQQHQHGPPPHRNPWREGGRGGGVGRRHAPARPEWVSFNLPEWHVDDVSAANESQVDPSSSSTTAPTPSSAAADAVADAFTFVELDLATVEPTFIDYVTSRTRYDGAGYPQLAEALTKEMLSRPPDPTERFRSLVLDDAPGAFKLDPVLLRQQPQPSVVPNWQQWLPDAGLNREFAVLSHLRSLDVPLGPRALEALSTACTYLPKEKRHLPQYRQNRPAPPPPPPPPPPQPAPRTTAPAAAAPSVSQLSLASERSWTGPSNDVRLSGASASSSAVPRHEQPAPHSRQYGRQNKQQPRRNSTRGAAPYYGRTHNGKGYDDRRETAVFGGSDDECNESPRDAQLREWEGCYSRPSSRQSGGPAVRRNHRSGYKEQRDYDSGDELGGGRGDYEDYEYGYRDDSGYQGGDHDRSDYHYVKEASGDRRDRHRRYESPEGRRPVVSRPPSRLASARPRSPAPAPTQPIPTRETEDSSKTPDWRTEYYPQTEGARRKESTATRWRACWSEERPRLIDTSEEEEEPREDPDAREASAATVEVPPLARQTHRCLAGMPANSCAAFADDLRRVELSTWSGETDVAAVTMRVREKYATSAIQKAEEGRTIMLALPRTHISLVVGAGGEAELLFDNECTEVLVRGRQWAEIEPLIEQTAVKTRDFTSYSVNKYTASALPITSRNTLITFASLADSRSARERLREAGIDAKRIPRDLITGNWDGSYAKRECLLDLEWERHPTVGISVRFRDLVQQNNVVDQLMRTHSAYFATSRVDMEEYANRMYVGIPFSPYPVSDDLRFLKTLLDVNGVDVTGYVPMKDRGGPQRIDSKEKIRHCTMAVNRRMLKVAIDEGVWGGFHPRTLEEWQLMLEQNRFSWVVEIDDDEYCERKHVNTATVKFDSYEQGERIAAAVQRATPCRVGDDRFLLNKEDRKGVFARAKLRVHYNVPVLVAALVQDRLRELDRTWRFGSCFDHAFFFTGQEDLMQWACLVTAPEEKSTPPGYTRLFVEGFPRSKVEECCAQLLATLRGEVIRCGDGADDEAMGWLLTGVGRNMADAVAKDALNWKQVLVDFNVLGREIRLIGERDAVRAVEDKLRTIATQRNSHRVRTSVTIGQPSFMHATSDAIVNGGGIGMLQKAVGECLIKPNASDPDRRTLCFDGTPDALERFRDLLGEIDDTLRESARAEYDMQRKRSVKLPDPSLSPLTSALVCPICSCRPSADYYRLEACGHVYCIACVYHQLHSELSTRTLPLACRRGGCGRKFAVSDLLRLLLGRDPETCAAGTAAEHLDELKLRPLVTAIVTNALQTKRDKLIACRTADCAGIFERHTEPNSIVRCKTCERTTCGACGYEPHREYSCEEYEALRDNVDVSIASYMRNKKVRKCPNGACSAVIEKIVGCNHMECIICRTHFCWLCGHSSMSQGDIYAHMQNDHGGNGLHMDDGEMFMLQFDD